MSDEPRVKLSRTEADVLLAPGEYVHTFVSASSGVLLGCDVKRETILSQADGGLVELAGDQATAMRHGVVVMRRFEPPMFCKTKEPKP